MRIIAKRTSVGSILTQALLARVDAIAPPGIGGMSRDGLADAIVSSWSSFAGPPGGGDDAITDSIWDFEPGSRIRIGTPDHSWAR